jgi:hypothetical protein
VLSRGLSSKLERSFVAIQWEKKDLPELYTRAAMGRPVFYMGKGLQ